jgi:site-specific DNA-cytosine methylase
MGVRPLKLNANMVSAQNRNRLFWTNIPVNSLPVKKHYRLTDILEPNVDEKYFIKDGRLKWLLGESGQGSLNKRFSGLDPIKAGCLTKRGEKSWNCNYVTDNGRIRTLTPIEYERLQCVPDNYTAAVPDANRYEMLGNGWNVDIIKHIFKHLPQKFKK